MYMCFHMYSGRLSWEWKRLKIWILWFESNWKKNIIPFFEMWMDGIFRGSLFKFQIFPNISLHDIKGKMYIKISHFEAVEGNGSNSYFCRFHLLNCFLSKIWFQTECRRFYYSISYSTFHVVKIVHGTA